jgi:hypothetical protein
MQTSYLNVLGDPGITKYFRQFKYLGYLFQYLGYLFQYLNNLFQYLGLIHFQSYFYNDDTFNFNYAQAKAAVGNFKEAEEVNIAIYLTV